MNFLSILLDHPKKCLKKRLKYQGNGVHSLAKLSPGKMHEFLVNVRRGEVLRAAATPPSHLTSAAAKPPALVTNSAILSGSAILKEENSLFGLWRHLPSPSFVVVINL